MRLATGILLALLLCGAATADKPAKEKKTRNPFGVKDIEDPDGEDVVALAKSVVLKGDDKDANAEQWVKDATEGKKGSLDGEWLDRFSINNFDGWNTGKGTTKIKVVDDRVYMLVEAFNGQFLIDLKYDKKSKTMAGRYRSIVSEADTGPVVFLVVDDERIDGNWRDSGRWDFRRKLKQEK